MPLHTSLESLLIVQGCALLSYMFSITSRCAVSSDIFDALSLGSLLKNISVEAICSAQHHWVLSVSSGSDSLKYMGILLERQLLTELDAQHNIVVCWWQLSCPILEVIY